MLKHESGFKMLRSLTKKLDSWFCVKVYYLFSKDKKLVRFKDYLFSFTLSLCRII